MDKVAIYKGQEIAREKAIEPITDGKFNITELTQFYHKVGKNISYDNSKEIQFKCFYQ
jgi:hypothetical protein